VHLHTKYVDKCRRIMISGSGSIEDRYVSRLRKLKRISEKLEKILQNMLDVVHSGIYDSETIERLELLLFYVNETALPSEREVWKRLGDILLATINLDLSEQLNRIDKVELLTRSIHNIITGLDRGN